MGRKIKGTKGAVPVCHLPSVVRDAELVPEEGEHECACECVHVSVHVCVDLSQSNGSDAASILISISISISGSKCEEGHYVPSAPSER